MTDGEPTAHLEGRDLVLAYPPSERTMESTLAEVQAEAGPVQEQARAHELVPLRDLVPQDQLASSNAQELLDQARDNS